MNRKTYLKMSSRSQRKYGNKKIIFDGITFDSSKEFRRYNQLKLLEKAGKITDLEMQVKYLLIPCQREPSKLGLRGGVKKGKLIEKECSYYADFVYKDENGKTVVEDTKGYRTTDYIIKRKLMLFIHGIRIIEL